MTAEPRCEAIDLAVGYGNSVALTGLSFSLRSGELWGVLGPNGAGKSALVRTLMGLIPPLAGEVRLLGKPLGSYPSAARAQRLAWVPQRFDPIEGLTGLELVLMGRAPFAGPWQLASRGEVERATALLAELGVAGLADRPCEELSGGEQRLLLLARAWMQTPEVLLLDEPTAFLDLKHQVQALGELRRRVDAGLAALTVLHDVNLAAAFCDRVLLVKAGRMIVAGPTREVLAPEVLSALYDVAMVETSAMGQPLFSPRWRP